MRRFSRVVLVSMVSVVLVSIGIAVGVYVADAGSEAPAAKVTFSQPVIGDAPRPTDEEITQSSARGFQRASIALAVELASPQTIANVSYVAQATAELKR